MLASASETLPLGNAWTYEIKWDGYRALAVKEGSSVRLISRNEKNLTNDYPTVVSALRSIKEKAVLLDGEIVALDGNGRPSFQALQHRSTQGLVLAYVAFDVLTIGYRSLIAEPLSVRRKHLTALLSGTDVMQSEPLPAIRRRLNARFAISVSKASSPSETTRPIGRGSGPTPGSR